MPFVQQLRKAFTLIELLVVVVIIAVLAGVITAQITRARENGWSARCKSNLRSLHQATLSYVLERGGLPGYDAGVYERYDSNSSNYSGGLVGWVTCSPINMANLPVWPNSASQTNLLRQPVWWGDQATWSIEKGELWNDTSKHAGAYLCPKFARPSVCGRSNAKRSYVMNTRTNWGGEVSRQMLYTEMQPRQTGFEKINGSYPAVCSRWAGMDPSGDDGKLEAFGLLSALQSNGETIGFLHPMGGEYRGHCVFMDGHVEAVGLQQPGGTYSNRTYDACNGVF